ILQASGASGVVIEPQTEDEVRFGEALDWALRKLAFDIVRDGEGSKRVGRVGVRGGSEEVVTRAARAVANSPLVKAALNGGDPNWGRIAQAVGAALPGTAPLAVDLWIEGAPVCARRARCISGARSGSGARAAGGCGSTSRRWPRRSPARRWSTRSRCPARAPR